MPAGGFQGPGSRHSTVRNVLEDQSLRCPSVPSACTVPSEGSTGHRATHGGLLVVIETRGKDESRHVSSGGWAVQGVRSGAAKLGTSEFVSRSVCERLTLFCFCFCAVDCAV